VQISFEMAIEEVSILRHWQIGRPMLTAPIGIRRQGWAYSLILAGQGLRDVCVRLKPP
jgi:hypothetical protein